jgi:hypothetical protein
VRATVVMVLKTLVYSPFNLLTRSKRDLLLSVTTKASHYIFTDFDVDITNKVARAIKCVLLELLSKLLCVPRHLAEV